MEGLVKRGEISMGKEKFCISLNLPGRPGLGIMERGEVWKGPIRFVTSEKDKGPIYSDSKNPFHTNLNNGVRSAPPNTMGIALSFGGVINRRYSWLQDRPLGHVIRFTCC